MSTQRTCTAAVDGPVSVGRLHPVPATKDPAVSSPAVTLPFCQFCGRALVSPASPGETEPYFDLAPGEEAPACVPGHRHEVVTWAEVAEEDAGLDLPLTT